MVSDAYHHYPSLPGVPTRGAFLHDWSSRSQTQKNRSSSHSAFLLYYAIFMYILYRYHTNLKLFCSGRASSTLHSAKIPSQQPLFPEAVGSQLRSKVWGKGQADIPQSEVQGRPKDLQSTNTKPKRTVSGRWEAILLKCSQNVTAYRKRLPDCFHRLGSSSIHFILAHLFGSTKILEKHWLR